MLNNVQNEALRVICDILKNLEINWVIIGSTNHTIQGMDKIPHDIDIIVETEEELKNCEKEFKSYVVESLRFERLEGYSVYTVDLSINSVPVQIMGEYRKDDLQNIWGELDRFKEKKYETYEGMRLPVLSLKQEYNAYSKTGRTEKALMIKEYMNKQ